jgi:DNA-directed RNA polymerase beta subunit
VPTTGQPLKGRKRGGGIRVGEMERDALLAHGTSFLVQDRLLNCSDYTRAWLCKKCGSFLSSQPIVSPWDSERSVKMLDRRTVRCRVCAKRVDELSEAQRAKIADADIWHDGQGVRFTQGKDTAIMAVPGVLRYLDAELAAMGVKMKYKFRDIVQDDGNVDNPVTVMRQAEEAEWLLEQQLLKEEEMAKHQEALRVAEQAEGVDITMEGMHIDERRDQ